MSVYVYGGGHRCPFMYVDVNYIYIYAFHTVFQER